MELWIRSQNKGALIKVEMLGNIDGVIYSYLGNNITELGKYKSSERALEVLDEIQNIILLKDLYLNDKEETYKGWRKYNEEEIKLMRKNLAVYEMPKE